MAIPNAHHALRQYHQINTESATAYASPHRLIQMLMEGALDSLTKAKGHIQRGDIVAKGEQIGKTIGIVGGLREELNLDVGGSLAANLAALYDYMQQRLAEAHVRSEIAILDEVAELLRPIKEAWDAIGATPNAEETLAADAPV